MTSVIERFWFCSTRILAVSMVDTRCPIPGKGMKTSSALSIPLFFSNNIYYLSYGFNPNLLLLLFINDI